MINLRLFLILFNLCSLKYPLLRSGMTIPPVYTK
uniref:Uncharacterized protein n=1 Tax=Siphoviridae sp. ctDXu9 TaxID=2825387 RepID=A0A8S5VCK8_9CAUD|nr:MAG TPA: hypothetical protein [Siphoviridae sp. ctDXu9]